MTDEMLPGGRATSCMAYPLPSKGQKVQKVQCRRHSAGQKQLPLLDRKLTDGQRPG